MSNFIAESDNKLTTFGKIVYAIQMFFGGWFLLHGLNHWLHFFPQPPGSSSGMRELIGALINSGLFDLIKGMEVLSGVLLLVNRWVPLGIATAFPTALVIGYGNVFLNTDTFGGIVAVVVVGFNFIMMAGYFKYYKGLFAYKADTPNGVDVMHYLKNDIFK